MTATHDKLACLGATMIAALVLLCITAMPQDISRRAQPQASPSKLGDLEQAPRFETPLWQPYDDEATDRELARHPPGTSITPIKRPEGGVLLLRRESASGGALLLKHTKREPLYKYDPQSRTLIVVTNKEWQRASGAVINCDETLESSRLLDRNDIHTSGQSDRLAVGEREIATAGKETLDKLASPSGQWVAVLSADYLDAQIKSLLENRLVPIPYYHQVMSLPEVSPFGKTVIIKVRRESFTIPAEPSGEAESTSIEGGRKPKTRTIISVEGSPSICWSADEQFIVYYQHYFLSLSIVETGLPLIAHPVEGRR